MVDGAEHDHTWVRSGQEVRTAVGDRRRDGRRTVIAGLRDLTVLKSTGSEFRGFLRDGYTTLRRDRRPGPGHVAGRAVALRRAPTSTTTPPTPRRAPRCSRRSRRCTRSPCSRRSGTWATARARARPRGRRDPVRRAQQAPLPGGPEPVRPREPRRGLLRRRPPVRADRGGHRPGRRPDRGRRVPGPARWGCARDAPGPTTSWLSRAVALATANVADGGGPFGALVVRGGRGDRRRAEPRHARPRPHRARRGRRDPRGVPGRRRLLAGGRHAVHVVRAVPAVPRGVPVVAGRPRSCTPPTGTTPPAPGFDDRVFYELFARRPAATWPMPVDRPPGPDARPHPMDAWLARPTQVEYRASAPPVRRVRERAEQQRHVVVRRRRRRRSRRRPPGGTPPARSAAK